MPDVLVRNVPKEVLEKLKMQAKRRNRSLQRELLATLRERSEDPMEEFVERVEAMREQFLRSGRVFTDSTAIIRELRER